MGRWWNNIVLQSEEEVFIATSSFLLLVAMPLLLVAMPLLLVVFRFVSTEHCIFVSSCNRMGCASHGAVRCVCDVLSFKPENHLFFVGEIVEA